MFLKSLSSKALGGFTASALASILASILASLSGCTTIHHQAQTDDAHGTDAAPHHPAIHQASSTDPSEASNTSGNPGQFHASGDHHQPLEPQTQAKLVSANPVSPNQPVPVTLVIEDKQGQAISSFDVFQEKLMHLIVVSDDLQSFQHIHPTYQQNGRFEVMATFPRSGPYTLFSDYKPAQQAEEVSTLKLEVSGPVALAREGDRRLTKTFGETKANLTRSPQNLKVGEAVTLNFNLQDAETGQPLSDLQPYLGERGHLVILRQSPSLSRSDYIHAHPLPEDQAGQVQFQTVFSQAGNYKIWGQFKRNGQIVTTDFWLEVS